MKKEKAGPPGGRPAFLCGFVQKIPFHKKKQFLKATNF